MGPGASSTCHGALDGAGALLWVGVAVGLGYAFAGQVNRVLVAVGRAGTLALAMVLGVLALYVGMRWWHRHRVRVALRMPRISPAELHAAMIADPTPLVLDVRASAARQLNPRLIDAWIGAGYAVRSALPATGPMHDPTLPPRGVTG